MSLKSAGAGTWERALIEVDSAKLSGKLEAAGACAFGGELEAVQVRGEVSFMAMKAKASEGTSLSSASGGECSDCKAPPLAEASVAPSGAPVVPSEDAARKPASSYCRCGEVGMLLWHILSRTTCFCEHLLRQESAWKVAGWPRRGCAARKKIV